MSSKSFFSFIFSIFALIGFAQSYPQNYFSSPLDIPLILSGTFGELRSNHFHAGMDIKTNGVEGLAVRAAAEGEIVRIAVSPYGYGNALYIRHPNGYTTVYAHLRDFTDHISSWVEEQQYEKKSFQVNLFPPRGRFPVAQGDLIASSGNSGGSGGPHLHFEVRDSRTEEPINPLLFGFEVPDHRTPIVKGIYAYPLDTNGHLNQRHERTSLSITALSEGEYAIKWPQKALGNIGFSIETIDRLDGAWNANGPYSITQYVNDKVTSEFFVERLSFDETRYINAHIDYELYSCCKSRSNRMWVLPGNELKAYRSTHNNGILNVETDSTYQLKWVIKDVAGNTTTLKGNIKGEPLTTSFSIQKEGIQLVYDEPNYGRIGEMSWQMEANSIYEDVQIEVNQSASLNEGYGLVYTLGSSSIPVHKHYTVQIPLDNVPEKYRSQAVIVSLDDNLSHPDSWDGTILQGKIGTEIKARVRTLGSFTVMVDSIPPSLRVVSGLREGVSLRPGQSIKLKMTDNLSGIQSYACYIDKQWYLMSYDAKNDTLSVLLNSNIPPGNHMIEFVVKDDRNNETRLKYSFEYSH